MRWSYRVRGAHTFSLLFSRGMRINSPFFTLLALRNQKGHVRLAMVVSKKVSRRAHVRNRLRRRAREWMRTNLPLDTISYDVVLVYKKECTSISRLAFYDAVADIFNRFRARISSDPSS